MVPGSGRRGPAPASIRHLQVPAGTSGRPHGAKRSEGGFVGGFEGLLFGTLIFVAGGLLVAGVWATIDTKLALSAAARVAATSYVQAANPAAAATAAAGSADVALEGWGLSASRAQLRTFTGPWARCSRVTITIRYPAPGIELPWIGKLDAAPDVAARASELIGPYRAGIPGTSACA